MMTNEQVAKLPIAQQDAMRALQARSGLTWDAFLSRCQLPNVIDSFVGVVDFHGMFIGIEADGYTHS